MLKQTLRIKSFCRERMGWDKKRTYIPGGGRVCVKAHRNQCDWKLAVGFVYLILTGASWDQSMC